MELSHLRKKPAIPDNCYVDVSARINGNVVLGNYCSVWFHVAVRGDVNWIRVGDRTNIQDHCTFHTTYEQYPLLIGNDVSFGHGVIAHGCTIGNRVLLGMQSLIMDDAVIGDDVLLGAGSLVTEGTKIPSGVLAFGRPARVVRDLTEAEIGVVGERAKQYADYAEAYRNQGKFTGWRDNPGYPSAGEPLE